MPNLSQLKIELEQKTGISTSDYDSVKEVLNTFHENQTYQLEWLLDTTEKFCKSQAIFNAF